MNDMTQKLLEPQHSSQYDPFSSPPNLDLAQTHRQATMVGAINRQVKPQFCPCCDHIVNKDPLPICFQDEDLLLLGVGYPLYYKIAKYFLIILLGIFFISGSAMYFFMTLGCETSKCLYIFGVPVINTSIMQQQNQSNTQIINTVTSIMIFALVLYLKTLSNRDVTNLTAKKNCQSLYSVMLQNVPDVNNEELKKWVEETFEEKPVEINWAYDVREFSKAYKGKMDAVIQSNKIKIKIQKQQKYAEENPNNLSLQQLSKTQAKVASLTKELDRYQIDIKQHSQTIQKYNVDEKACEKVGTVFVTFEEMKTVIAIIEEYQCSFFKSFFKSLFVWVKKSKLFFNNRVIVVNKAPAPRQIIWQNLRFSYIRSLIFQVIFIVVMILLLGGALRVILLFMNYSLSFRIQGQKAGQFWVLAKGMIIALLVVIINCVMRLVIQVFTYAKRYYSYTKYQGSFILYYSLFYVVNSCCVVYIVHQQNLKDSRQLLLTDIHFVMLANAFSQPLFKLFDPIMWFRFFRRQYISKLPKNQNPYTQQYTNKAWQGHEISNADNYQYMTRVLFITTWFATVAPVGVFLSIGAMVLDYWISKWMLVRNYKIPENVSEDIANPTLMGLELLPLVYILGVLQFNYKVSSTQTLTDFFLDFLNYGVTTLLLLLSVTGYIIFCRKKLMPNLTRRYSKAKLGFRYRYQSSNPITKLKGDINYLYDVLKQSQSQEDNDRITKLLELSRKDPNKLVDHREEIFLLKMQMEGRVSQVKEEIQMEHRNASQL